MRSMALVNVSMSDAVNSVQNRLGRQIQYNFWQPITAIRKGDQDGSGATERDAGWQPLNATPMHPEYPSHAGINARAARAF
jgi:hypothetical protein